MARRALHMSLTALVLFGVVLVAPGHAYKLAGKKWPKGTITYHSAAPQYEAAIESAVAAWNASGAKVRFKPASRSRAKLRILYRHKGGGPAGDAILGWTRPTVVTVKTLDGFPIEGNVPCGFRVPNHKGVLKPIRCKRERVVPRVRLDKVAPDQVRDPRIRIAMAQVVAHELGHALGLAHVSRGCAMMRHRVGDGCREAPDEWQLRCRLLEADDVRGAIRRYGGRLRPLAPEFCESGPPAPQQLVATYAPDDRSVSISWSRAAWETPYSVAVVAQRDRCTATPVDGPYVLQLPGDRAVFGPSSEDAGRYCVTAWSEDEFGLASRPTTTWVDVPAAEPY